MKRKTLPPETEAAFQKAVIDAAHALGWRVAHFRPARTAKGWRTPVAADGAGWPDLVLYKGTRLLFLELKSATGRLTTEQAIWLACLSNAGVYASCFRPSDWHIIMDLLENE